MRTAARHSAAAALLLACAAAGCGTTAKHTPHHSPPQARYEPAVKATFLRACKGTAGSASTASARCSCVLSKLEARASQKTLQDTERAIVKGEAKVPEWMIAAASACNG
jgi:hypothetical protein